MDNTQIRPNRQAVVHVKQGASVQIVIDQYLVRLATSVNMASQTAQPVVKESTAQLGHLFVYHALQDNSVLAQILIQSTVRLVLFLAQVKVSVSFVHKVTKVHQVALPALLVLLVSIVPIQVIHQFHVQRECTL